ncbi:universal stress protein [Rarobacter faecitabidus]|uniref:Nucleotide-binding universal stress UspA family protein n=1 Tax=Rarobacter faecitabidus TaxID=13243 RepID=A0A542ZTY5_RARFA|nr:universal stress protein [Rarobacter faecitabidus]TQL63726.1 nucleotide-binding universal stress UspA family protein [Rarobacter faecitabidus]
MVKRIVVGVDGSTASKVALAWAIRQAQRTDSELIALCSYSLPSFTVASLDGGYAALDDAAIADGARQVAELARQRAADAGVNASAKVVPGDAAAALIDISASASLVVVGTRGGSGIPERLLGTVSSALPAHAKCPTVLVPRCCGFSEDASGDEKAAEDAVPDIALKPIKRIVVGVDGSVTSQVALRVALREARAWEAEVVVVGGVPIASGSGLLAWLPAAIDRQQIVDDVRAGIERLVDQAVAEIPGITPEIVVLDGTGAELLTRFSKTSDLLVLGSRGRGGFAGLLLGSTSQAVLHHSSCPVLVINKRTDLATASAAAGDSGTAHE